MENEHILREWKSIGENVPLKGSETIFWDDPKKVWLVAEGEVNLFVVPWENGRPSGKKEFLMSITEGGLITGLHNQKEYPFRLQMHGMLETELIEVDQHIFFAKLGEHQKLALLFQHWEQRLLDWVDHYEGVTDDAESRLVVSIFMDKVYDHLFDSAQKEMEQLMRLREADQHKLEQSVKQLMQTMKMKKEAAHEKVMGLEEDPLIRTCQFIGEKSGIRMKAPLKISSDVEVHSRLAQIARASHIRFRQTTLHDEWWKMDNGALIGFRGKDKSPVALIPKNHSQYDMHDFVNNEVKSITKEVAKELDIKAFQFYRPFPAHKLNVWGLMKYASVTKNIKRDFITFFILGIAGGLFGLAIPIGLGQLVDQVIPGAERGRIVDFILILGAIAVAMFAFQITRSIAMLRLEGRMDANVQAAVWDRVLNLPVPFFRNYTAGDLSLRANSIHAIRQTLSGTTLMTIFTAVFSSTQYFLLFYYSKKLALIATGIIIVAFVITALFGYFMVRNERELASLNGKLTGLVLQLVNGVAKFRTAGAEKRAFGLWSDHFSAMRKISFKTGMISNYFALFNAIFPIAATIVLFYSVMTLPAMSTGAFLAFHSAFTGFIASIMAMGLSLISVLGIIPLYERAKPILQTIPEIDEEKEEVADIQGAIEMNYVNYQYDEDGPLILEDVSIRVEKGEFIAIVGTSGSGKSTLMRLLIGFDRPLSGGIYYDNRELDGLDIQSVRNKLGVVLQGGQLLSGDIFTNIVGTSNLTIDDAWEAAEMAGLKEDIQNMPMGMFTMVDEGARTISGGQRQRLMIARALVNKPKIIFFDEATSALDNRTQKVVSDSIEQLNATRIVIAHRLSTIINADRIYVLDKGKIVEQGTFDELMDQKGMFSNLAKRQMA